LAYIVVVDVTVEQVMVWMTVAETVEIVICTGLASKPREGVLRLTLLGAVAVDKEVSVMVTVTAGAVVVVRTVSRAETPVVVVVDSKVASPVFDSSCVVVTVVSSVVVTVVVTGSAVLVDVIVVVTQV
jgi:hypothetical protein